MTMDFTCRMARALEPDLRWLARRIAENVSAALPDLPVDGRPEEDDPIEVGDDGDWGWSMLFGSAPGEGDEDGVDVDVRIVDAQGSGDDEPGCAVRIGVCHVGGELLGDWCPHNYSFNLWVRPGHPDPEGDCGVNDFVSDVSDLQANLHGAAEAAGLDPAQTRWLLDSARARISGLRPNKES